MRDRVERTDSVFVLQDHARRFHAMMNEYQKVSTQFKTSLQERTRRELKVVMPDLTETKVEELVENGEAQNVLKEAIISEELDNVVAEIEERHKGIIRLEQQVREIYELFRDLANLVDLQQEALDVVSKRVQTALDYAKAGNEKLVDAEKSELSARKVGDDSLFCFV